LVTVVVVVHMVGPTLEVPPVEMVDLVVVEEMVQIQMPDQQSLHPE
jgi:hypothetical protein